MGTNGMPYRSRSTSRAILFLQRPDKTLETAAAEVVRLLLAATTTATAFSVLEPAAGTGLDPAVRLGLLLAVAAAISGAASGAGAGAGAAFGEALAAFGKLLTLSDITAADCSTLRA